MFHNRLLFVLSIVGIFINILLWIALIIKFGWTQEAAPLHYNIISGIDFVGDSRQVYQLPLIGLVFLAVNIWLGRVFYSLTPIFSYFLIGSSVLLQIFFLIPVIVLMVINS